MNGPDDTERVIEPGIGWQLLRLRHAACEARAIAGDMEDELDAFDPDEVNAGSGVVMSLGELAHVAEQAHALQDLADVAGVIAGGLGRQLESVVLSAEDLAQGAQLALRAGSGDRASVVLSARMLGTRVGFAAVADAITTEPGLVSRWGTLTVRDLLAGFRDSEPALTRRMCVESGVHPDTEWASLDVAELDRLASQLRGAAG